MSNRIAIVGVACRYPDADSRDQFWENVLAGRRAFRRLPDERMNQADYYSPDPAAPDRFYSPKAAVLRDYEFDRVSLRVAGSTYRSTDLTHWLALDVAAAALADAGFPGADGLPKQATGVVIGNSLTGEFSRANLMRLRWPYVRRTVGAALAEQGWTDEQTGSFLAELEGRYKAPYPPIDEDTLAGGLANTIAGRICNYFDLHGGGYTVDGACSSSLLSVATAAKSLAEGDIDVAIAGGVDLSIDPFEVIGFAKTGALATGEMRVYDRNSCGFWPGEGCGMVVLMRERDALDRGLDSYAVITGWGISSDGKGGITRPEAAGHRLALTRAYGRAGYGVQTVSYFEGHGTGTELGDATELEALSSARRDADPDAEPAALSTVKGNIGHTKAAAGVAGLIKATLAVHHQIVPPATGHIDPHPSLLVDRPAMRVPQQAELWPDGAPIRAGVSAMGFGGINTHIAIEAASGKPRRTDVDERTRELVASRQDAELLLIDAPDIASLRGQLAKLAELAAKLSYAELADLAGTLAGELSGQPVRAAVVATSPEQAEQRLTKLVSLMDSGARTVFAPADGLFAQQGTGPVRIAYLFPGQGSGRGTVSALRSRFAEADELYAAAGLPAGGDQVATEVAQPRIVSGSLAGLRVLERLGITAETAVGHSLGELTALHWGGALDEAGVLALAGIRGRVMANASQGGGSMAGIVADAATTEAFLRDEPVVIAGYNGPHQTVVSGPADAVERVCARASSVGFGATRINVSHAFHSPLVEPAAVAMTERLAEVEFAPLTRPVVSTVTADVLDPTADLRTLLRDQVLEPVRFHAAAALAVEGADLAIEVGPGRVLAGLLAEIAPDVPTLPVDTDNKSLAGLLTVVGAAWALGAPVRTDRLYHDRLIRPLSLEGDFRFLASPCESAPSTDVGLGGADEAASTAGTPAVAGTDADAAATTAESTLDVLRRLAAERVELPLEAVSPDSYPLDDLHLSSITVGQLVNQVVQEQGRPPLTSTANFATVTLAELAEMIDELAETALPGDSASGVVTGVEPWVRAFGLHFVEARRPVAGRSGAGQGDWTGFAPDGHPLAEPLRQALRGAGIGDGVLLCLPQDCEPEHVELFLAAARAALAAPAGTRFVVVQHGRGASGLAKTLHLEAPHVPTLVIDLADVAPASPAAVAAAVELVVAEAAATTAFTEVRYDAAGGRTIPLLQLLPEPAEEPEPAAQRLGPDDVLLVTGGGKGITAECALALARDTGAKLALLGRADPETDAELAANLARMAKAGARYEYLRADVTSPEDVWDAVTHATETLGPVTAVLHGAGRNEPSALTSLDEASFRKTLAPKIDGLRAVLAAIDPEQVKLLITFGSIIGRAGLRGEAHYATANDWMTELTVQWQREHPHCRALALEWSVWSGAGMGERLGVVEALIRDGITPIPTDEGIAVLRRVLADESVGPVVVVTGRIDGLPTVNREQRELPLLRFVDRTLVHYPGIELVTETELSAGSDPYLSDHLLDGDLLFPAVIGMEAMAQVATAVSGHTAPPVIENAEFLRPIVVSPTGSRAIRLAALVRSGQAVDLVIRSAETGFSADHFRATLRFPRPDLPVQAADPTHTLPPVPVDPTAELYGGVLFQGKRFQKLLGYRRAAARQAVAEIARNGSASWFAPYLPQELLLADPGTRDAMMHSIQCCVPDATLLPESVERLHLAHRDGTDAEYVLLDARERVQEGDSYVYDLQVLDPSGVPVERWEGLRLRAVRKRGGKGPWVPALLGAYLERALENVLGGTRSVVVEPDPANDSGGPAARRAQTELAVGRALGRPVGVTHRPDGKPEIADGEVSASHGGGLTLVVAGAGRLTCDVEAAVDRAESDWAGLLGPQLLALRDQVAGATGESAAIAGTRAWAALECVRKTGAMQQALAVDRVHQEGWVLLSAGSARVATWVTTITGREEPVVFAVLVGREAVTT